MGQRKSIADVTDTALWVAALRACESRRKNAAVRDPLAESLAGERGGAIARSFPNSAVVAWGVVMRTSAIDRLIDAALQMGIDTVINLGAGLDTRPYRMRLPAALRWVEIDFPGLIAAKNAALAQQMANCRVERVGLDLLDRPARERVFAAYGGSSASALLIAEGMIPYWPNDAVKQLAQDCLAVASFRYWILDFDNAGRRKQPRGWATLLQAAPFLFEVDDWFKFFADRSWRARTVITSAEESVRLQRRYPWTFPAGYLLRLLPRDMRTRILSASGAALLERGAAPPSTARRPTPGGRTAPRAPA